MPNESVYSSINIVFARALFIYTFPLLFRPYCFPLAVIPFENRISLFRQLFQLLFSVLPDSNFREIFSKKAVNLKSYEVFF